MVRSKKIPLYILLFVVAAITLFPFIYGFFIAANYETAEISDLSVGYLKNGEITFAETIPAGSVSIYVCGNLQTTQPNYLAISLHDSNEQSFLGRDNTSEPYRTGNFCAEIKPNNTLMAGTYKIIVIDQHDRIGELLFEVE